VDRRSNPYAPGAGTPPPELAGRDDLLEDAAVALDRTRAGLSARGMVFYGLRGVGKTVLLNELRRRIENVGASVVWAEAPENRSLPAMLAPAMKAALARMSRVEATREAVLRARRLLNGFAKALKVKYADLEMSVDLEAGEEPLTGDLEIDLGEVLEVLGEAAEARSSAVALMIDEIQYVPEDQLAALLAALHRVNQRRLPIVLFGAGLPQILGTTGRAKSYAERLLHFVEVDRLSSEDARAALCRPAEKAGAAFSEGAVEEILRETEGYPYFLQEWGKHAWDLAEASPIEAEVARLSTGAALAELDRSFFRVRYDRLTPAERRYMRAMAELGPGPHRSGDIAETLGQKVTTVAPRRNSLIAKGMIFSPSHGDTAFTVPLFDGFMKRIMPEL
jgi:hypothetical protein